jgi:hypothetical protein
LSSVGIENHLACFITNSSSLRFFKRVAVALEREASALEGFAERFDAAWQRLTMNVLYSLGNLGNGQGLGPRHFKCCGDHPVGQGRRTAAVMAAHQVEHAAVAPRVVG